MSTLQPITTRNDATLARLLAVWESSVRATHTFLSQADILTLKPTVHAALAAIPQLVAALDETGAPQGFIGVAGPKIEMLFVAADARGLGIGGQLAGFAITTLQASLVDVNEQNPGALGFYRHLGFAVIGRSARDEQGRPFPILHLALPSA